MSFPCRLETLRQQSQSVVHPGDCRHLQLLQLHPSNVFLIHSNGSRCEKVCGQSLRQGQIGHFIPEVTSQCAIDGYRCFYACAEWWVFATPFHAWYSKNLSSVALPLAEKLGVSPGHVT